MAPVRRVLISDNPWRLAAASRFSARTEIGIGPDIVRCRPMRPPVNASRKPSRATAHELGPDVDRSRRFANVFRGAPESGHCSIQSALRICAIRVGLIASATVSVGRLAWACCIGKAFRIAKNRVNCNAERTRQKPQTNAESAAQKAWVSVAFDTPDEGPHCIALIEPNQV